MISLCPTLWLWMLVIYRVSLSLYIYIYLYTVYICVYCNTMPSCCVHDGVEVKLEHPWAFRANQQKSGYHKNRYEPQTNTVKKMLYKVSYTRIIYYICCGCQRLQLSSQNFWVLDWWSFIIASCLRKVLVRKHCLDRGFLQCPWLP